MYIKVILSKYLKPNRWPKSGPLALNGVLLVAPKWPVGKQGVNDSTLKRAITNLMKKWCTITSSGLVDQYKLDKRVG